MNEDQTAVKEGPSIRQLVFQRRIKIGIALLIGGGLLFALTQISGRMSLQTLIQHEADLRLAQHQHPIIVTCVAFLAYAIITGLSLPVASLMSAAYGWYFGFVCGLILVSFASTAGATLAFLLSRFLFRDAVTSRLGARVDALNESLQREGPFFLFGVRMMPAVPFFIVNAGMGLTPMNLWTFWWVSQLGMLPGTIIYVYVGSTVPSLQEFADQGITAAFSARQIALLLGALFMMGAIPLIWRGTIIVRRKYWPSPTGIATKR